MSDKRITTYGLVVTGLYLCLFGWYLVSHWAQLRGLAPNEVGDFLAGAFGPLALAWVVIGYFQQGIELKQNTQALQLQVEELRRSVEEQSRLADLSGKQLELQMRREEAEAKRAAAEHEPRFVNVGEPQMTGEDVCRLRVVNEGAPVVVVDAKYGGSQRRARPPGRWETGEEAAFLLSAGSDDSQALIRFRQDDGRVGEFVVSVGFDANGQYNGKFGGLRAYLADRESHQDF